MKQLKSQIESQKVQISELLEKTDYLVL